MLDTDDPDIRELVQFFLKAVPASLQTPLGTYGPMGLTLRTAIRWPTDQSEDHLRLLRANAREGVGELSTWMDEVVKESGCASHEEFILGYEPKIKEAIPPDQLQRLSDWYGSRGEIDSLAGLAGPEMTREQASEFVERLQVLITRVAKTAIPLRERRKTAADSKEL